MEGGGRFRGGKKRGEGDLEGEIRGKEKGGEERDLEGEIRREMKGIEDRISRRRILKGERGPTP